MRNPFRRRRYTLVAMRLANMVVGHPEMKTDLHCDRCREVVGVYPSGQRILARFGKRVDLVCEVCHGPLSADSRPAPGARLEIFQGRRL